MKTVDFKFVDNGRGNFWAWSPNGETFKLTGTYVLASEAQVLEAERDRLKAYVSVLESNEKLAVAEIKSLRARHAALVEKLEHDLHDMACVLASYKLKAALAEVKP
jgi:hypothetical protein